MKIKKHTFAQKSSSSAEPKTLTPAGNAAVAAAMFNSYALIQAAATTEVAQAGTVKKDSSVKKSAIKIAKQVPPDELKGLAKVKWRSLQSNLQTALGDWNELDQNETAPKSKEEEQLDKVKTLIESLKHKLNDF